MTAEFSSAACSAKRSPETPKLSGPRASFTRTKSVSSSAAPDGPSWGLYAAAVIAATLFLEILQWPLLPRSVDAFYHMAVAESFRAAGGYVTHAFWEWAPEGRPHLYPPLLHTLLVALRGAGFGPVAAFRVVEVAMHPLVLAALWACVRRTASPRAAFFAVALYGSVHSAYAASFDFPAENIAAALGLFAIGSFARGWRPAAAAALALAFYAHALYPWIAALALLLYGASVRRPREAALVATAALVLASPFLFHEFSHAASFRLPAVAEDRRLELDLTTASLGAASLVLAARRRVFAAAPLGLLAASLFLGPAYRSRLTGGHGWIPVAWLAALALEWAYARFERRPASARIFLAFALFWIALAGPVLGSAPGAPTRIEWGASTLARHLWRPMADPRTAGLYDERQVAALADAVRAECAPDEILWSDLRYMGALLTALTGRASSSAGLDEVRPARPPDAPAFARAAVCFKENGSEPPWVPAFAAHYGFERARETAWAVVYRRRGPSATSRVPRATVPTAALVGLPAALVALAAFGTRANRSPAP